MGAVHTLEKRTVSARPGVAADHGGCAVVRASIRESKKCGIRAVSSGLRSRRCNETYGKASYLCKRNRRPNTACPQGRATTVLGGAR